MIPPCQVLQWQVCFQRHMKDGAHAGANHLGIERVDAAGAQQAAKAAEPGQGAQDGAQVARVLDFVEVDRFFAIGTGPGDGSLRHGDHRQNSLGGSGIRQSCHLTLTHQMGL